MRINLLTAATVTALTLTAPIDRARAADAAAKPPDVSTSGITALPDAHPADAHAMLSLAPRTSNRRPVATAPEHAKAQSITTSTPVDPSSLSPAQRQKLASIASAVPAPQGLGVGGVKPADVSTIVPPRPAEHALSPEARERQKLEFESARSATAASRTNRFPGLGVIPRPEWAGASSPAKPKDVSTIEKSGAGAPVPAPSAIELARRAAPTLKGKTAKASEVSTTGPRDPSRPSADAKKTTTSGSEVHP